MNNEDKLKQGGILILAAVIAVSAAFVTWLAWTSSILSEAVAMFWLYLNTVPFIIAVLFENLHEPHLPVLYIMTFLQWFLVILLVFRTARKLRKWITTK